MICFAKSENFNDILSLWKECFPAEDEFRDWFFGNVFDIEKTLIYIKDNQIAGMLQMIFVSSNLGNCTYIYGAGTSNKFRKQGIMGELIEKSFEISKSFGHEFSMLIPASDKLFKYYEKFGYLPNLSTDIFTHYNKNSSNSFEVMQSDDLADVLAVYQQFCTSEFALKRDVKYFNLQRSLFADGAVVYRDCGQVIGYSFGYRSDDCYNICEIFSSDIKKCLSMHSDEKIVYKTVGNNTKIGSIKSLCDKKEPFGYVNLLFN